MKISRPASAGSVGSICCRSAIVRTPGIDPGERVSTIVVRFGSGLPMDSNVYRPMTMTWPVVVFLNHLKSSGKCHGMRLPAPITRLSDMAAIALKGFTHLMLAQRARPVNARGAPDSTKLREPLSRFDPLINGQSSVVGPRLALKTRRGNKSYESD